MISRLAGNLLHKSPTHCIVDVGGVGYEVMISLTTFGTLPEIMQKVTLDIHTHVREDVLQLFGFATAVEKKTFLHLISISGVGPKTAMSLLSGLPPEVITKAIASGDSARISSIPGIGKKTAERIIVELKDKMAKEPMTSVGDLNVKECKLSEDVVSALINLGYRRQDAEIALKKASISDTMRIEDALRQTLRELTKA